MCPISYHYQCLNKKQKIVKDGVILCELHKKVSRAYKAAKEDLIIVVKEKKVKEKIEKKI